VGARAVTNVGTPCSENCINVGICGADLVKMCSLLFLYPVALRSVGPFSFQTHIQQDPEAVI